MNETVQNAASGIKDVVLEAISSKKFLVAAGSAVAASLVLPKIAIALVGVWILCQTVVDVVRVIIDTTAAPATPETIIARFQAGLANVVGGLLGSKKAIATAGVAITSVITAHPYWAAVLVVEWLFCQTAVDVALVIKHKKS
jgi:hypothetical protein